MDQLAEIQTEGMPAAPIATGNARADSLARAEHFKATVAYFETKQGGGFVNRGRVTAEAAAPAAGAVQPSAEDLAVIEATHKDLLKRFPTNNQARAILEHARFDVFAGKPLDREALSASFGKAVETSDDRATAAAVAELSAAVDQEGGVSADKIPARLMHGYSLPGGMYDAEETIALLSTARQIGLTQDSVDKFIELSRGEE